MAAADGKPLQNLFRADPEKGHIEVAEISGVLQPKGSCRKGEENCSRGQGIRSVEGVKNTGSLRNKPQCIGGKGSEAVVENVGLFIDEIQGLNVAAAGFNGGKAADILIVGHGKAPVFLVSRGCFF